MNTNPFLVNALLNDVKMVQALVDNGCLCYGIIDDKLTNELNLPRFPISPRVIETAEDASQNKPIVDSITNVSLDLDGYITPKLWLYVVLHSTHILILGKKWLEDQDAIIHSKEQRLELRKTGGSVCSVKRWRQMLRNIPRPKNTPIEVLTLSVNRVINSILFVLSTLSLSIKTTYTRYVISTRELQMLFTCDDDVGTSTGSYPAFG